MEHTSLVEPVIMRGLPEFVPDDFKSVWVENMSNENYHSDRTAVSSSALKILLQKTPAHFLAKWMSGMTVDGDKEHFRYGSIAHMAVLEPERFKSSFLLEPKFEALTKGKDAHMSSQSAEAKRMKAEWYASIPQDALVVTERDYGAITGTIKSIIAHEKASKVIVGAKTEMSGYFRHKVTGIKCRLRPDILHLDKRVVVDFKTTRDASRDFFSKEIARHMYHVSIAFYGLGIEAIEGWRPDVFAILASEKEEPYASALYTLDKQTMDTAYAWVENGMAILKKCLESKIWPGLQDGLAEDISIPPWAHTEGLPMFNFEEEEEVQDVRS